MDEHLGKYVHNKVSKKMKIIQKFIQFYKNFLFEIEPNQSNVAVFYRDAWIQRLSKKVKKGSKILDVGAGTVPYKKFFPHCIYKTHDFGEYQGQTKGPLLENWKYGAIDYISDISHIPAKSSSFDIIICTEVFEHIPKPIEAIKEIARLLKPGGKLFLTAPLASGLHQEPYHFYGGFTPHFYRKFLPEHNLKIIKITPTGGFFKHVGQEVHRSGRILRENNKGGFLLQLLLVKILPQLLWKFDEIIFIPEFTMDYMIEAKKISK